MRDLLEAHASLSAWYYELWAALRAANSTARAPDDAARAAFVERLATEFPEVAAIARTIETPRLYVPAPPPARASASASPAVPIGPDEPATLIEPAPARVREGIREVRRQRPVGRAASPAPARRSGRGQVRPVKRPIAPPAATAPSAEHAGAPRTPAGAAPTASPATSAAIVAGERQRRARAERAELCPPRRRAERRGPAEPVHHAEGQRDAPAARRESGDAAASSPA